MNILALTKYDRAGASSRLRFYQYQQTFTDNGHRLHIQPLLPSYYLNQKYFSKVSWLSVIKCYWKRFRLLFAGSSYDILWVEKEIFPYLPFWLERCFIKSSAKLVLDYDDAVFHNYDLSTNFLVRKFLGKKLDKLMARADLVVGGNNYLCSRGRSAGSSNVQNIPTVIDKDRYSVSDPETSVNPETPVDVGWIGSPATAHYLQRLEKPISRLRDLYEFNFVAIGARQDQVQDLGFKAIDWSEELESKLVAKLSIGVMPLDDSPWDQGKCGYKLIQYMACGLPVVAAAVGANKDIVEHGVNGYLVSSEEEWFEALKALLSDSELRKKMGQAGRELVEEKYCLQVQSGQLMSAFSNLFIDKDNLQCAE